MDNQILRYNSNPFSLAHTVTDSPNDIKTHIHNCYELFYYISGDLTYYIEGQAYKLSPNDMILTNSRELHRIVFNSKCRYERKYIHFKPEYISSFQTDDYNMLYYIENRKLGYFNRIPANDVLEYKINELWEQIEQTSLETSPESQIMRKAFFVQLLITINKIFSKYNHSLVDRHKYDHKIVAILDYINKNLDEKISLDLLQQTFFVNKFYLCHIFKMNTGFTVMEYITYKRIMRALELLTSGMTALDAAHAVGYGDYSTFYKAFKHITGVSPKQYYRK
ncbi:HTH-type transcriptional activator RhaR [Paenibacillus solanacearum]|uniref:HTH-type transcriptional activator RhaR n=1 Tax=Paenibacillus solanacearum TaxID=2048548 RepID=A0A916K026_9BACL|nr:helix-turn-helix domain-containing protein [Paenibacillus solanacearum]CAG7610820.1 HTH-type transcriptional activator RhaR [Paenibacillus solanacearum]